MKRIIFFRHLPHIWDNGKYMINHKDYCALLALGRTLNIDAIIHSPRTCDHISALALNQGCKSKVTVKDEYLMDVSFLRPSRFLKELRQTTNNNGLESIAIIAGQKILEILGCPSLEHGEFYIQYEEPPTSSNYLVHGSIEDFRDSKHEVLFPEEAVNNLY